MLVSRRSITLALLLAPAWMTPTLAAERSYPLRIRGGKPLQVTAEPTKTKSLYKVIVVFSPAPGGAAAGLRPGQGSWTDRALRAGEPTRLEYAMQENDARWLIDHLRSAANYYTFDCYNTGKGYMQVTKGYVDSVRID